MSEPAVKQRVRRDRRRIERLTRRAIAAIDPKRYDVWETTGGDFHLLVFSRANRRDYRVIRIEAAGTPPHDGRPLEIPPGVLSAEIWTGIPRKPGFESTLVRGGSRQEMKQ